MKHLIVLLTFLLLTNLTRSQECPDLSDTTQNLPHGALQFCSTFFNPTTAHPSHIFTPYEIKLIYEGHPFMDNDFPVSNPVKLYSIVYKTTHTNGDTIEASGALIVPSEVGCDMPMAIFCKGTVLKPDRAPSGYTDLDPYLFNGFAMAGNGFITVVPDYLGYGIDADTSSFHPYVHAPTEATSSIDMLKAAQDFVAAKENSGINWNGELFIYGHSQGGHTALALQREIERNEGGKYDNVFPNGVTATATISGIFDLSNILLYDVILSEDPKFFQARVVNLLMSYRQIYGDRFDNKPIFWCPECDTTQYQDMRMIFADPVTDWINHYQYKLQNTPFRQISFMQLSNLYANEELQCYLNGYEIVNLQCTGNNISAQSTKRLFKPEFLQILRTDTAHPLIQAMKENDVYTGWAPIAPIKFYYCVGDDILSTQSTKAEYFLTHAQKETPGRQLNLESIRSDAPGASENATLLDHAPCQIPSINRTFDFFRSKTSLPFEYAAKQPYTSGIKEREATLNWENVPGVLNYNIRYKTTTSTSWSYVLGLPSNQFSYHLVNLLPGARYEWQMAADYYGSQGCFHWSPLTIFKTICPMPDTVSTQINSSTSATFNWTVIPDAIQYQITGGLSSTSVANLSITDPATSTYTASGLATNNLYNWQIRTICHHSNSQYTEKEFFALSGAGNLKASNDWGVVINNRSSLIEVYPNPVSDQAYVSFGSMAGQKQIDIFDQQGVLVRNTTTSHPSGMQLELDGLSNGTYQVVVTSGQSSGIHPLTIVR